VSAALRRLPLLLVNLRLLLVPPLWALALAGMQRALAVGLLVAVLTDMLDGMAARRLGQSSEALARFDSLADKVLTLSVLAWLLLLHPAILAENAALALVALLLAVASWLAGLLRHGRVTGLHLRLARFAGLIQAIFVLHTFWQGAYSPLLFTLAAGLWCLAAAEELLVQLTHRHVDGATRSALPPWR
jgi:phosphatidylglycerophosphate synthase